MNGILLSTGNITIAQNSISGLNSTGSTGGSGGTIVGIGISGGTTNLINRNSVCDLSTLSTNPTVAGVQCSGGTTNTVQNNVVGDLRATAANAANPVIGINISGGTTALVYNNTVRLSASSSGALFGSSAISASTTPALTLRNNILVNLSTPNGAGNTVAYRRSTTTLTSYQAASDRNLFYIPGGSNRLVFFDGTNSDATLLAFQTRLADARDDNSISEAPDFASTTCGASNFLRINPATPTSMAIPGT
jgi:hypothetical protein